MELLNQQKIAQLGCEIGQENIPLLLEIFLKELQTYQVSLAQFQGEAQLTYLLEISHALKSSAASFAADKLCSIAEKIDAYGKCNDLRSVAQSVSEMQEVLNVTYQVYCEFHPTE